MKKPKIFMEFFYLSLQKKYLYLDSAILFWKKTKVFMETLLYREKATEKQGSYLQRRSYLLNIGITDIQAKKPKDNFEFVQLITL